jgi:geranylgeranyl diphosphate synthase, type II
MDATTRIERVLTIAIARACAPGCPPRLADAMRHAVFPGGARIRPRVCLAVAKACGEDEPAVTDAAAAAIELLHCASLVHDDLPCFDDAATRRGKPSVHCAFGEPVALLTGDALIVLAFQTLAWGVAGAPQRLSSLLLTVGRAAGAPTGIAAGQAWECEPAVPLAVYHRAKTGALFAAATVAGAASAGAEPDAWRAFGETLGEAYQVADDLRDVAADPNELGKPTGVDAALGRPSAVQQFGINGAIRQLEALTAAAADSIPACPGAADLRAMTSAHVMRFLPKQLSQRAA